MSIDPRIKPRISRCPLSAASVGDGRRWRRRAVFAYGRRGGQGAVLLPRGGLGRSRSGENRRQPARLAGGRSRQSAARRIIKGSLKANFQAAFCGLQTFQAAIGFKLQWQPEKQNRSARCQTVFCGTDWISGCPINPHPPKPCRSSRPRSPHTCARRSKSQTHSGCRVCRCQTPPR